MINKIKVARLRKVISYFMITLVLMLFMQNNIKAGEEDLPRLLNYQQYQITEIVMLSDKYILK